MKKIALSITLSIFYISCNNPKSTRTDSLQVAILEKTESTASDTLDIDLIDLKAKDLLKNTQIVTVNEDPVYHKAKKFNALSLKEILEKFSSIKKLNAADTKVVFECEDGYKPEMPLEKLLSAKAFLAISDVDAPKDREWEQLLKNGQDVKMEPFYIVYEGVSPKDVDYKWPYNLVKIHLAPLHENDAILVPKDATAMTGYNLFKKYCQTCHAINKIGGKMGPELNFPKNVTEYWKTDDLKAFIQNPASYRNDVKMPKLGIKPAEAIEIVKYLEYMSKNKL
ncbi:c-type cytochrome [Emticicia sp. SJ17W-69]|uniref:c-type cytochrome n=1 Tax=Emticicia sp. SJ17W-69 TaxID=3421657 RepID=UPI003EBAEAA5